MVTTLVRHECKKCVSPDGKIYPCSIEQLWYPTTLIATPKFVRKQWCLVPPGYSGHQCSAEWKTTKYVKEE